MTNKLPPFVTFLWTGLLLFLLGWGGLVYVILTLEPTPGPRWLFFFLLTLALSGTALPVMYFLNRRFPVDPPVESAVIVREAMWVGIYGDILAWLQLGRVLTPGLALLLAAVLLLVEFLLRLGERSTWPPARAAAQEASADEDDEDEDEDD